MRSSRAALAAALCSCAVSWGQDTARDGVLTEAEFLTLSSDEPAALRVLREELGLARAGAVAARALRNPRLAASREAPASATEQVDLTIAWEPPRPDRRRLAVAASDAAVTASESRLEVEQIGIRLAMRQAFARWALAVDRTAILSGHAERLESLAASQRQRAAAGEVAGLDARRMTLAAAEAKANLARSEGELASARAAALVWRPDLAPGLTPELRPVLPVLPPAPGPAASHPEVAALEAELVAARLEQDLATRVLGLPGVVAGWQRQRSDAGMVAEGPLIGLEWPVPLFDRGRAERARAEARVEALEARLELTRGELSARREGALASYAALRAAASEAAIAEEAVEPMVIAATASFRAGEATLTDLLETLRAASDARLQTLDLRGAGLEAYRELERLAGAVPDVFRTDDQRLPAPEQGVLGKESDDVPDP